MSLDALVQRSNRLGTDLRVINTGGGNASAKSIEIDPATGDRVEVLWVKGSGGDLRIASAKDFADVRLGKLHAIAASTSATPIAD